MNELSTSHIPQIPKHLCGHMKLIKSLFLKCLQVLDHYYMSLADTELSSNKAELPKKCSAFICSLKGSSVVNALDQAQV